MSLGLTRRSVKGELLTAEDFDTNMDLIEDAIEGGWIEGQTGARVPEILRTFRKSRLPDVPRRLKIAKAMATPPTFTVSTAGSQIAPGRYFAIGENGNNTYPYNAGGFVGFASPHVSCAAFDGTMLSVSANANNTLRRRQSHKYCFMFDGDQLELNIRPTGTAYQDVDNAPWAGIFHIEVDGEYVELAGHQYSPDNVTRWIKLTFESSAIRRIDIYSFGIPILGVITGPTGSVTPAKIRGPRMICVGDSFTAAMFSYVRTLAHALEWDDVWNSGVGGTGFVATGGGASQNFSQRWATDVLAFNPDIVWCVGSGNDDGQLASTVVANTLDCYNRLKAARPDALFIWSHNSPGGPARWTPGKIRLLRAVRAAIEHLPDVYIVHPLERKMDTSGTVPSGTVRAAAAAGSSTLSIYGTSATSGPPAVGSILEIGDERVEVVSVAYAGATYFTITLSGPTQLSISANAPWVLVGSSYLTGRGDSLNPTGWGNADRYVSTDTTHPNVLGQQALGLALADEFLRVVYEL